MSSKTNNIVILFPTFPEGVQSVHANLQKQIKEPLFAHLSIQTAMLEVGTCYTGHRSESFTFQ